MYTSLVGLDLRVLNVHGLEFTAFEGGRGPSMIKVTILLGARLCLRMAVHT